MNNYEKWHSNENISLVLKWSQIALPTCLCENDSSPTFTFFTVTENISQKIKYEISHIFRHKMDIFAVLVICCMKALFKGSSPDSAVQSERGLG